MKNHFNYTLPKELIAQVPLKEREKARLMFLNRGGRSIGEGLFSDIAGSFNKGDVLVLNNSKVIPARLRAVKPTGGKVEVFLLKKKSPCVWEVLLRGNIKEGYSCSILHPSDETVQKKVVIKEKNASGSYLAEFDTDVDAELFDCGDIPLPPYIKRPVNTDDAEDYQTVYAEKAGSVAAHTAGLHFTANLIEKLISAGVKVVYITLHIGWSSFKILKQDQDNAGEEYFEIDDNACDIINGAKERGNSIFAVGTSTVRTLESSVIQGKAAPQSGYTDLFITPGYRFKVVDALVTNFHLPGSTHLYLVSAFAGHEFLEKAYSLAVNKKYRFYSYGDAMLIT